MKFYNKFDNVFFDLLHESDKVPHKAVPLGAGAQFADASSIAVLTKPPCHFFHFCYSILKANL